MDEAHFSYPQPTSPTEIKKSIPGFANGSYGGMDGLRPQHLKDVIGRETGNHELQNHQKRQQYQTNCY